jgi:hypothetical protein
MGYSCEVYFDHHSLFHLQVWNTRLLYIMMIILLITEYARTVRSIISAPPLQNAVSHTTAERNGTAVVASILRWCDSRHFAAVVHL